ncbi:MAG: glutamine synthetase [Prolixibacteraceae bacterium]|nr:glutamine synthetase [Prolixibacteraceae bacterium]
MDKELILKKIKESEADKIKYAVTDIDGILRGKYIHKKKLLDSIKNGLGFCDVVFGWDANDSCYDNVSVTGWHTGYPDAKAFIDLQTYREIPWENYLPFFLADFESTGKQRIACPRSLLKKVIKECETLGFNAIFSLEYEWFNFKGTPNDYLDTGDNQPKPITPGMFGYSVLRSSLNKSYFNDLFDLLNKFNIPLESIHTETGPGVFEAAILADNVLQAADKAVLLKTAVKEIAYLHEMTASFMAKWNDRLPGCGAHIHQSLWDQSRSTNLFYNSSAENGNSEIMKQYIAGQLYCLPFILPMYAPNINSYKRIGHGDWAPATVSWGFDNRTTAARIIKGDNSATRIEFRVPGADINPYLVIAASLASGLYGIKNKMELKVRETTGNAYSNKKSLKLPGNLSDALQKMKNSKIAAELFGDDFTGHFIKTREWEVKKYEEAVTDWELKRYFEII